MRPWLLLKHLDIPFTGHMVSVAGRDYNPSLRPISANSKVPCLHVDGIHIWESLAIATHMVAIARIAPSNRCHTTINQQIFTQNVR